MDGLGGSVKTPTPPFFTIMATNDDKYDFDAFKYDIKDYLGDSRGEHRKHIERPRPVKKRTMLTKKTNRNRNKKHQKFDSTLGFPGEGPDFYECKEAKCIYPHFHRSRPFTGARRRLAERKRSRGGTRKNATYVRCQRITCSTTHYHESKHCTGVAEERDNSDWEYEAFTLDAAAPITRVDSPIPAPQPPAIPVPEPVVPEVKEREVKGGAGIQRCVREFPLLPMPSNPLVVSIPCPKLAKLTFQRVVLLLGTADFYTRQGMARRVLYSLFGLASKLDYFTCVTAKDILAVENAADHPMHEKPHLEEARSIWFLGWRSVRRYDRESHSLASTVYKSTRQGLIVTELVNSAMQDARLAKRVYANAAGIKESAYGAIRSYISDEAERYYRTGQLDHRHLEHVENSIIAVHNRYVCRDLRLLRAIPKLDTSPSFWRKSPRTITWRTRGFTE